MYSFIRAYIKDYGVRTNWVEKDISEEICYQIVMDYKEVVLLLSNPFLENDVYVNIKDMPEELNFKLSEETLNDFLIRIDNANLPSTQFTISDGSKYVRWLDGFSNNFNIQLVDGNKHYTNEINSSDARDLRVTKDGVDSLYMFKNCLFTVNGLLHRSNYSDGGVELIGGAYTNRASNMNLLGVMYFGSVGNVDQVAIKKEDITGLNRNEPLSQKVYIRINKTPEELKNKSILMSVAGFLLIPDGNSLRRCGENIYELDFKNQPWMKRLLELHEKTCLSCMNRILSRNSLNKTLTSVEEFYSNESIKVILSLTNSFFIIVDTPELNVERKDLEFSKLPGKYVYKQKPDLPLVTGLGTISEYHFHKEYDRYSLTVNDSLLTNYQFETTDWKNKELVDSSKLTNNSFEYSKGYFLKLYK